MVILWWGDVQLGVCSCQTDPGAPSRGATKESKGAANIEMWKPHSIQLSHLPGLLLGMEAEVEGSVRQERRDALKCRFSTLLMIQRSGSESGFPGVEGSGWVWRQSVPSRHAPAGLGPAAPLRCVLCQVPLLQAQWPGLWASSVWDSEGHGSPHSSPGCSGSAPLPQRPAVASAALRGLPAAEPLP